jgi:hypothetical protein
MFLPKILKNKTTTNLKNTKTQKMEKKITSQKKVVSCHQKNWTNFIYTNMQNVKGGVV